MICRKCGELIHDSAKFCSVCGAPQQDDPKSSRSVMNPARTHYERCTAEGHAAPGENQWGPSPKY